MKSNLEHLTSGVAPLPEYREILLAVDSSDHSNTGVRDGIALAQLSDARISAAHVYAAQMHDLRFRQMEGGLPEQFRQEEELERQRDVHDSLITRGLSIITDSYLDQPHRLCKAAGVKFRRRALEGKNYRQMVNEANSGDYDLLVIGALGLGAVEESRIGTVCERVVRRSDIDTLVIKSPAQSISQGPVVVAIDGSTFAYGGLLTGLQLAREWQLPLQVISAFDPYYHYVAFNRIAGVLSEEAGKVFRFQEQERLHEEIIDSGLAKIYDGHLQIARDIASDYGVEVETSLLDGKPYDAITRYLREVEPSLLIIGKRGIHADDELDIGGNAENLLRNAPCAVLLSQREFQPQMERIADVTVSWSNEATERLKRAPEFVQNMARVAILRYAQERGHTVITERIVEEATASLMPGRAEQAMAEIVDAYDARQIDDSAASLAVKWSDQAYNRLKAIQDSSLQDNIRLRAEKKARSERAAEVTLDHLEIFLDQTSAADTNSDPSRNSKQGSPHWQADALARLMRVPEGFMRDASRQRIEHQAKLAGTDTITMEIVEAGLQLAREAMVEESAASSNSQPSKCPFANSTVSVSSENTDQSGIRWTTNASARLEQVPAGYCRNLTKRAVETLASQNDLSWISSNFLEDVLKVFKQGSSNVETELPWTDSARNRISLAPDTIRGMLISEIEAWARREGVTEVDDRAVRAIKREWQSRGVFHLEPGDPRGDE